MIEIIGFTPGAVGNADASPIQTPFMSCSSPRPSATDVAGSLPIRQAPIWCAVKHDDVERAVGRLLDRAQERVEVLSAAPADAGRCAA